MGDYTKLIVSCEVECDKEDLKKKIVELDLGVSAYHSQEVCKHIEDNNFFGSNGRLNLVLCGQTKYGRGQDEFLEWLRPFVTQGSGEHEIFAFQITEYEDGLTIHKKVSHESR